MSKTLGDGPKGTSAVTVVNVVVLHSKRVVPQLTECEHERTITSSFCLACMQE